MAKKNKGGNKSGASNSNNFNNPGMKLPAPDQTNNAERQNTQSSKSR